MGLSESTPKSPALVQRGKVSAGEAGSTLRGAKDKKASMIEDFLVNGNDHSPFDPAGKIKISIPGNNGGGNKKKMH